MTNSYDPIAEQYKRSKLQPWRTYIECFTLMNQIGDPRGLAVLDVGCGEGFYTRMIRERDAGRVIGIDLSHRMIELARTQDAQQRLGIEYVVGDARELPARDECAGTLAGGGADSPGPSTFPRRLTLCRAWPRIPVLTHWLATATRALGT